MDQEDVTALLATLAVYALYFVCLSDFSLPCIDSVSLDFSSLYSGYSNLTSIFTSFSLNAVCESINAAADSIDFWQQQLYSLLGII